MVNLNEQILLTIAARDNASNVAKNIDSSFQGMASNLSKSMSSISNSMMNFSAVSNNALQGLTGKSALDNIFGTTSKNETNQVLLKNMMDDLENHYDAFYDKVDKTTDNSIVSMQELIPALKAFKSATGATDEEMTNVTEGITNFGAAVLAQTGSTDLAQQAMMDLSKGAKGAFASLDQYGISEDALMRTGLWSGKEEDVEGYIKAVTEVTGSTEELMQTNQGLDALIGKSFSRAGKKIGNEFLPQLKDVKRAFIDLDNETGGALAGSILATGGAIEVMNQGLWNVSTTVQGIKDLKEGFVAVKDAASGAASMIKSFGKTTETVTVTAESLGAAASHANGGFSLLPANFDINSLKKEADIVEDVVEESTAVGALAPGAAAASAEVEVTSGAMAGLSASFTSMIVPLLSLAAVIAVMSTLR